VIVDASSSTIGTDGLVRTVLGDVPASSIGACDYHDHLFQVTPLLVGDELDDEGLSRLEAHAMVTAGVSSMIEATPVGLGRNPSAVARISAEVGLAIVHTTGAHHSGHYPEGHWVREAPVDVLADYFAAEVEEGLSVRDDGIRGEVARGPRGEAVRAGVVKAGAGYWRINPSEQRVMEAAAAAAAATGVSVMVHLEHGSASWEALRVLNDAGLPSNRVVLAHIDRNLDPGLHRELAWAGAYLGYDGMARHREWPDSAVLDCMRKVAQDEAGASRILIGADVARRTRFVSYGGMPGLAYLPERFFPRMRDVLGSEAAHRITTENPARVLTINTQRPKPRRPSDLPTLRADERLTYPKRGEDSCQET